MVVSSLSGLNYFQFVQTKLSLFCLYVTSYRPPPMALYNQSQIPLPEENNTVCMSGFFCIISFTLTIYAFYSPLQAAAYQIKWKSTVCSGMKTVVLVFDFLVCVLWAVIHINRASWKLQHSIVSRP